MDRLTDAEIVEVQKLCANPTATVDALRSHVASISRALAELQEMKKPCIGYVTSTRMMAQSCGVIVPFAPYCSNCGHYVVITPGIKKGERK